MEKNDFLLLEGNCSQYVIGDEELRTFLWAEDTMSSLEHSCSGEMFLMERVPRDERHSPDCFLVRICSS